jgi:cell division initiation protein
MPFAPHEIENKRFVVALRGYQTDEVEAFLRSVAADYAALLAELTGSSTPQQLVADIERVMRSARDSVEHDAAEIRAAAVAEATQLRAAAEAEAAAVRAAAEREASALREATQQEAEACFEEITRQAEQLHKLENALWSRMHALEHTVMEARQTLTHLSELNPMPALGSHDQTRVSPSEPYRGDESVGLETNVDAETAVR